MSSNLRAEPIDRKKLELGTALKFALRKKFGEPVNCGMSKHSFDFLEGLLIAGDEEIQKDVQRLIEFINKHGEILIKEEY